MKTVLKLPIPFIAVVGAVAVAHNQGNGPSKFIIVNPVRRRFFPVV